MRAYFSKFALVAAVFGLLGTPAFAAPDGPKCDLTSGLDDLGRSEGLHSLAEAANEIEAATKDPRRFCKTRLCTEAEKGEMRSWLRRKLEKTFLGQNKGAMESLLKSYPIIWAGYAAFAWANGSLNVRDYPWEFVSMGLLWGWTFSEIGCRNEFHYRPTQNDPFRRILPPVEAGASKSFLQKAVPYAAWTAVTTVPEAYLSQLFDEKVRGNPPPEGSFVQRCGFFMVYDTLVGPAKKAVYFDAVLMKKFPEMKAVIRNLYNNGLIGIASSESSDAGRRIAVHFADQLVFLKAYDLDKRYAEPALGQLRDILFQTREASPIGEALHVFDAMDLRALP